MQSSLFSTKRPYKKVLEFIVSWALILVSAIKYFVALIVPTLERGNDRTNSDRHSRESGNPVKSSILDSHFRGNDKKCKTIELKIQCNQLICAICDLDNTFMIFLQ